LIYQDHLCLVHPAGERGISFSATKEHETMLPAFVLVPALEAIASALTTLAIQKLLDMDEPSSQRHNT
jgi:hypothetical protein